MKPDTTLLEAKDETTNTHGSKYHIIDRIDKLAQMDTIKLSANYYSNPYFEKLNAQACKISVIGYKVQPLAKINFELPCAVKDYNNIEEPINRINQNDIFYINPMPEIKIISDPLSHKKAPVEEAPNGMLIYWLQKDRGRGQCLFIKSCVEFSVFLT